MKNSLGDIIYIIIMIVIAIISTVAKAKKKARSEMSVPENSSEEIISNEDTDILQEIDDWLNENREIVETKEVIEPIIVEKKEKTPYVAMESTFAKTYQETRTKRENKNINVIKASTEKEDDKTAEIYEWFSEPEDLQRAFIYSEILKRPNI